MKLILKPEHFNSLINEVHIFSEDNVIVTKLEKKIIVTDQRGK